MELQYTKTALAKTLEDISYAVVNGKTFIPPSNIDWRGMPEEQLNFEPVRKTDGSVGYDLFACIEKEVKIFPGQVVKIGTGICINLTAMTNNDRQYQGMPPWVSYFGWMTPRSSIDGLRLENSNGIIDTDYRGQIIMKLRNSSDEVKTIKIGDRLTQLIILPAFLATMKEVQEFSDTTERGENGFGSSGR
jgi:dUTP pyrophosphatase